jgi:4-hydroxybenzoate polyprenyltransferase
MGKTSFQMTLDLFRVRDWVHVLGLPLLGFLYARMKDPQMTWFYLPLCIIISVLYLAHGYSLNETYDTLKKHKGIYQGFFQEKGISFKRALALSFAPLLINLVLSWLVSPGMFLLIIAGAILSYVYSAPPSRFKEIAFADLVINALGFSILFLIGTGLGEGIFPGSFYLAFLFFIVFIPLQLIHELEHVQEDRAANVKTTVVRCGEKISGNLILSSLILLTLWSFLLYLGEMPFLIFILTFAFSFYIMMNFLKRCNCGHKANRNYSFRLWVRMFAAIYGLGILMVFMIYK